MPLAIGIYFCPVRSDTLNWEVETGTGTHFTKLQESPRWLMKKDRYPQAMRSLLRLRHSRLQAARDMYYISAQLTEEMKILGGETFVHRFTELFTKPRYVVNLRDYLRTPFY